MSEPDSRSGDEVEALIKDITKMAAQIGGRFVPDPEKRRIFAAATAAATAAARNDAEAASATGRIGPAD